MTARPKPANRGDKFARETAAKAARVRYGQPLDAEKVDADIEGQAAANQTEVTPREPEDGVLVRRAAEGDNEAASLLVDRYQATVRRFLFRLTGRRELADDLAQDTFIRMLRYADHYDPRRPLRTWLLTIARRLSINSGRRESRRKTVDDFSHLQSREADPAESAATVDSQTALRVELDHAMSQLTESQRQAVTLFHSQGLSVQEAAEVMGLPVGTVKSHLHRGRAAMRKLLEANLGSKAYGTEDEA